MTNQQEAPRPHGALLGMARKDLDRWARVYQQRDEVVRQAAASGLGTNEIVRRSGLAKTTVLRILRASS